MSSADPEAPQPAEESSSPVQAASGPEEESKDDIAQPQRSTGRVKWFSVTKGFGFIEPEEGEGEIFVHQTSIAAEGFRSLKESEPVEFDLEVSEDGRAKAMNVTGPGGAPPEGAPRRIGSAAPYPPFSFHPYAIPFPPYGYPPVFRGPPGGRMGPRAFSAGGRGGYPGMERPPPPGTPGISSGFQVVVHNLPWSITWQELKDIFSATPGVVRADVIIDSAGRSRGFGTVRYKTREEAQHAAEMMNNIEIGNRVVSVRIDRFA